MATYYVSPTGSDAAAGVSSGTAWQTLEHADSQVGPGAAGATARPGGRRG